ncbi:hypothetical protein C1646_678295 [Rhizophagus diaphanus]|nr:hypothetical protein C1646_678295 [Rhizophagus diaphanus] [Rhizophagus sp. MUCL 43196]
MIFSQNNVNSSDTEKEEESDNEYNYEEEEEEKDNNENNDEEEEDEGNNDDNNNQVKEERNNEKEEIHQIVEALNEDKILFCNSQFALILIIIQLRHYFAGFRSIMFLRKHMKILLISFTIFNLNLSMW